MSLKSSEVILKVCHLEKSFNKNVVLKNISTEVNKGEVVVVIGPSGSGKSTFLRCLNYLEVPSSGEIYFRDERIGHLKKEKELDLQRSKIGMVFQSFNLFPHLNVLENLTIAPINVLQISKEEADKRAEDYLKKVGLIEKINAYPRELSGGQQHRVAIARALCM
jgi:ABC-type polar amino acid transport system ATPase subunit